MKRTVTLLLALLLLVTGLALPAYAAEEAAALTPTLSLSTDKDSLVPGETVTVTLTLDQPITELNNYQFNVLYDADRFALSGSKAAEPTVVSAPRTDEVSGRDCITVSGLSTEGGSVALAAGTVAALTFTALDAAEPGEAAFTLRVQSLPTYADPTAAVALNVVSEASVTVGSALSGETPGDVNGDGAISSLDAVLVLRRVAGTLGQTDFTESAADVNGDHEITSLDAVLILKKVAGLITAFPIEQ